MKAQSSRHPRRGESLAFAVSVLLGLLLGASAPYSTTAHPAGGAPEAPLFTPSPTRTPSPTTTPGCGLAWRAVTCPTPGYTSYLYGVAVAAEDDVWAVGYTTDYTDLTTLVEHWDGAQWSIVPSPNVPGRASYLYGVAAVAPGDVWAVGESAGGVGDFSTLTMHWDGSQWALVPSPNAGSGGNILKAVTAIASDDVWAVGHDGTTTNGQALLMHWDGNQWSIVAAPNHSTVEDDLRAVSASGSDDVWAAGEYWDDALQTRLTLLMHWDGNQWSVVPSPNNGTYAQLSGVTALAVNDAWAVGVTATYPAYGALTLHWNGTQWSVVPNLGSSGLRSVAGSAANDVWAVGEGNGVMGGLAMHWDGAQWTVVSTINGDTLNGVAAVWRNDVWAVGTAGYLAATIRLSDPCASPTATPSTTVTVTGTPPTATNTRTPTHTPTITPTPSITLTPSPTRTHTPFPTPTNTTTPWASPTRTRSPTPWATDTPTPTPPPSPSAAATGTRTVTGTPVTMDTPSPTPTPCAGAGYNHIVNGDFENGLDPWWASGYPAPGISQDQHHSGNHSALLGNLTGPAPGYDSFLLYPAFVVPTGAPVFLDFWYWPASQDTFAHDRQEAWITTPDGTVLQTVLLVCANSQSWQHVAYDMTGYAGWPVRIEFGVHQDSPDNPTAMYVDDVSVALVPCATPTPGPPTGTPTRTPPPTQTPGGPSATATPCTASFSDVQPSDYFYTPVEYLFCHGVISGYADGTFRPYNPTTRAQMVKIVVLGFQKPLTTPPPDQYTFTDVPPSQPFFPYIETAAAAQIVSGYTCGGPGEPCDAQHRPYFRPNARVTRGQLSKITVAAAGWALQDPPGPTFADVAPGSAFYAFVETAACHGIVSGYTCGGPGEPCDPQRRPYFRQYNPATRGQIAKIVYGALLGGTVCP